MIYVKNKRTSLGLFALLLCAALTALPCAARTVETVSVHVNGRSLYAEQPLLIDGSTYVSLDALRAALGDRSGTPVSADGRVLRAGSRCVYMSAEAFTENQTLYIPLRAAAMLYGAQIRWDADAGCASFYSIRRSMLSAESVYDEEDLYWMSRIISAESRGEPLEGKLAVGTVVCNRVDSEEFPSTITEVIFDRQYGVQFTPVANGTVYDDPTQESVDAAKMILEGYRTDPEVLYFIYEDIATNKWTVYNCSYAFTIGCHDFYS